LAAALGIARGQRGAITVSSKFGFGSTFRVLLPLVRSVAKTPARPDRPFVASDSTHSTPPADDRQLGVLVVEDDEEVRNLTEMMVKRCGFAVYTAGDGKTCLETLARRKGEVDVMLLDVDLPGVSGGDLFRKIQLSNPGIPIVWRSSWWRTTRTIWS